MAVVRRQLGTRSVGHTGTLDPFATGLLFVLVGRATRLARFLGDLPKTYDATIRFGVATDTEDATGTAIARAEPDEWPDRATMASAVAAMVGRQWQRPPAYSAKQVAGERSYRRARRGEATALAPVEITVYDATLVDWTPPDVRVRFVVGAGTYVRALARDLGERLGIPSHCAALRRQRIGSFDAAEATTPEATTPDRLLAPAAVLAHLPRRQLSGDEARLVMFGRDVPRDGEGPCALLVTEDGQVMAVAEAAGSSWHPSVVLEPAA